MTSNERGSRCLKGLSVDRVPQQLTYLPWAQEHHPEELKKILDDFPADIGYAPCELTKPPIGGGDPYEPGQIYTDDWGCKFETIQRGVFGEIVEPLVKEDD